MKEISSIRARSHIVLQQGPFPLPTLSCILLQFSCALWLYGEWETKSMRVGKATEKQQEAEIYFNRPSSHHSLPFG